MQTYFITGTDTEVGKTTISVALLKHFQQQGKTTIGLKPIASGAEIIDGQFRNEDGLKLQQAATEKLPYDVVNPICLNAAIAPHIAASQQGVSVSVDRLQQACAANLALEADIRLVEGAGGWFVPLGVNETLADFVCANQWPVILVVGMRLGCINHALLTAAAIQQAGLKLAGWVANCIEPSMPVLEENITTLQERIDAPCWGVVPFQAYQCESLSITIPA